MKAPGPTDDPAAARAPRPGLRSLLQISVRNWLILSLGLALVFGALRHGAMAAGMACIATGVTLGLFHPNTSRGLGLLRGRAFNASLGGALAGSGFVAVIAGLLWWTTGQVWSLAAVGIQLLRWTGGGALAGGIVGLLAGDLGARRAKPARDYLRPTEPAAFENLNDTE